MDINKPVTAYIFGMLSLLISVLREVFSGRRAAAARRRQEAAEWEQRLRNLEIAQKVDQAKLEGELRLMNQQIGQAAGAAKQAQQLVKTALSHETI